MRRIALAVAISFLVAGCGVATRQQAAVIHIPFEEPAWSTVAGTASISGQAFLRTRGGEVRTCAGEKVLLIPLNKYTQAMYDYTRSGLRVENIDPSLARFIRIEVCSAQGEFVFNNLPGGRWLIQSRVVWDVVGRYTQPQGGNLLGMTETFEGKSTKFFLIDEHFGVGL